MTAQHARQLVSPSPPPVTVARDLLQRERILGSADDPLEREADRIADQVLAAPRHNAAGSVPPRVRRLSGPSIGGLGAMRTSVARALAEPGVPLDPALEKDMSQRFGLDFSQVRVHSGAAAEGSALDIDARAYTVGHHIVFGSGMLAPRTTAGRKLIAHELVHVAQQTGTLGRHFGTGPHRRISPSGGNFLPVQRQTRNGPDKQTLKGKGVNLNDLVARGSVAVIDEVLLRSRTLAPYIGDRLKGGFRISEKGKFVQDSTDGNFDDAYRKAYELDSSESVAKGTTGFFDPRKSEIHVRPGATFGTALHEAVHRLASPVLYSTYLGLAKKVSTRLMEVLKEGVTAFFTDVILNDEGLPNFNDAYRSKKKQAGGLIASLGAPGFDLIANFNFKGSGIIEIGEKLGFTRRQFSAAKGDGIHEVMKLMDKTL